jgi:hypothetical protein
VIGALALAAQLAANSTLYSDAIPPVRFQGDVNVQLEFVHPSTVLNRCRDELGVTFPLRTGDTLLACSRGGAIAIPNPCLYADGDGYARLLCHEIAHVNGWPGTHGD